MISTTIDIFGHPNTKTMSSIFFKKTYKVGSSILAINNGSLDFPSHRTAKNGLLALNVTEASSLDKATAAKAVAADAEPPSSSIVREAEWTAVDTSGDWLAWEIPMLERSEPAKSLEIPICKQESRKVMVLFDTVVARL